MSAKKRSHYEVVVFADVPDDEAAEAVFDRIAEAAHALNEPVSCSGGWVMEDDE